MGWDLQCPNPDQIQGACGQLLSASGQPTAHSASGDTLTYQPPTTFTVPGNSMTVDILAYATADQTKNVLAPVAITAFGSVLQGTYVFQAQGSDSSGSPYQIAGLIYLDGNGNISTNNGQQTLQQTLNTVSGGSVTVSSSQQNVNGGNYFDGSTYFIGTDGRGNMTLNNMTDQNGSTVAETFSLVVLSKSKVLIAELDSNSSLGTSSTGRLELQDPNAAGNLPTAGYAFVASGSDYTGTPTAFGGVLNIDNNPQSGGISGKGSLVDMDSANNTGLVSCSGSNAPSGSVSQSTSPGVLTFALNNASNCFGGSTVSFTGYIVDATHILIIETDDTPQNPGGFLTAGLAIAQGPATGTLTSFSGQYVVEVQGTDLNSLVPSSLTSLSVINADGTGSATGITDTLLLSSSIAFTDTAFWANYQVAASGIGRVHLRFSPAPVPNFDPEFVFYLTGDGTPPLVLYAAAGNQVYPALGVGIALPQASNAQSLSFSGPYGVSFTAQNGRSENDGSGQITADPTAATLSGLLDDSSSGLANSLTGTFAPLDSFGRTTGTFNPPEGNTNAEYYLVDSAQGFFVETDLIDPGTGQVAVGCFAQRCDVTTACQAAAEKTSRRHVSTLHSRTR